MNPAVLLLLLGSLGSCYSCERVDLRDFSIGKGFPVSTEPPPPYAEQVGLLHIQENGFYLLGVVPVIGVSLRGCLEHLHSRAVAMGADGLADVRYELYPADVFKFSVFPVPDWSARAVMTGTAYRRLPGPIDEKNVRVHAAPAPGKGR